METDTLIGVVYALPQEIVDRIIGGGKNIFVKYLPYAPTKKSKIRLTPGIKLYFYVSRSNKTISGEAVIKEVHFLRKQELLKRFRQGLMLNDLELKKYSKGREDRPLLTLVLKDIIKYGRSKRIKKAVNMGGLYITVRKKTLLEGLK